MTVNKVLISAFDHSGNPSRPYLEAGWKVIQIDIKHGNDFLLFDVVQCVLDNPGCEFGIIAPIPCTAYALSGNRHKKTEARKEIFEISQRLVSHLKTVIDYLESLGLLMFWQLENPSSDIHTHNPWLGKPVQKFNPCDFAGYLNPTVFDFVALDILRAKVEAKEKLTKKDYLFIDELNAYNKKTWLWGRFNLMPLNRIEPVNKDNPGWKLHGGKSERTKELRSITPLGFAYAFFQSNH